MLQVSISRIMSKIEGNLFFKYTFQVRETLSPMFALRQKYLEYFLRWYHFIQAKASPSRITTRKIPPKKAPTEEELELETEHGFGVVVGLVEFFVVGSGGTSVESSLLVMGSAVAVVTSVAFVVASFVASVVVSAVTSVTFVASSFVAFVVVVSAVTSVAFVVGASSV